MLQTRTRTLWLTAVTAIAAGAICAAAPSGAAAAKTVWLCKPGKKPNPCRESLKTTVRSTSGAEHVENPRNARRPKIDCFYVYPTVSEDSTRNSDRVAGPEEISIAV